jgi:hypothetical protein
MILYNITEVLTEVRVKIVNLYFSDFYHIALCDSYSVLSNVKFIIITIIIMNSIFINITIIVAYYY